MSGRAFVLKNAIFPASFPKLISWDHERIRTQICKSPSIAFFFDFMDPSSFTYDGDNRISQIRDFSGKLRHWTAAGADRPLLAAGTYGSWALPYFDGTNKMDSPALFSGAERMTIVAGLYPTGATDATSRIFLTDADNGQSNWFLTSTQLRHFVTDQVLTVPAVTNRLVHAVFTMDNISNVLSIKPSVAAAHVTGTKTRPKPIGGGTLGKDVAGTNPFIGSMLYMFGLEEDVRNNAAMGELISEYSRRRVRATI